MRAFFSYSTADRHFVDAVYNALEPDCVWIDKAEIEWGQRFLDSIVEGIKQASDFVLFWSRSSACSDWVKLETNMAFVQALKRHAIRIRVVRLDQTKLPLHLEIFQYLSVTSSSDSIGTVVSELKAVLAQPSRGARHRFLNRNSELERVEEMINDPVLRRYFSLDFKG